MHSVATYIKEIRLRQLRREIAALGPIYTIIITIVMGLLAKVTAVSLTNTKSQIIFSLIWSAILSTIHFSRKDLLFLKRTQPSSFPFLLSDYLLLSLIPISLLLYGQAYFMLLVVLAFLFSLCFIPPFRKSTNKSFSEIKFIPSSLPEWIGGIRKVNKFAFIGFIVIGILGSTLPFFSLFICWLLTGIITGFYQAFEPRNQLRFHHTNARQYLNDKIKEGLKFYLLTIVPIIFSYTILHLEQWPIILVAIILFVIILVFTIVSKYAYYSPGASSGPHQIYLTIGLLSIIIPFMVPVPLILTLTHYRKAINRLSLYFYDTVN